METPDQKDVYEINLEKRNASSRRPSYNRTIYFDNTMSVTAMQTLIDDPHRHIPEGSVLTFQFRSSGATTYTMTTELNWKGFYGGGELIIQGNIAEAGAETLHTTQDVFLDFAGQDCDGIVLQGNMLRKITRRNLKIRVKSDGAVNNSAFYSKRNYYVEDLYSYAYGNATTVSYGFHGESGNHYLLKNYVSNINIGIYASYGAIIKSEYNDDTGTEPLYGMAANDATIHKMYQTSQPAGSTNYELTPNGGKIWGVFYRDNTRDDEEGLLIQSGKDSISGLDTVITFDIAYSVSPHVVMTCTDKEFFPSVVACAVNQFTGSIHKWDGGTAASRDCYWIAIGKRVG